MNETANPESPEQEAESLSCKCTICGYHTDSPAASEIGHARGNTARFLDSTFTLWKCPQCESLYCLDKVDLADIYKDYTLNENRSLDGFAKGTLTNLLGRLVDAGLEKHHRILDVGCGTAVFLQFMRDKGYANITGYDPYVPEYAQLPDKPDGFDCVVANDVLEHVEDPRVLMSQCRDWVTPGGLLYVGTADSEGVHDMGNLEPHLMRLHLPFHRVIVTRATLMKLGAELELEEVNSWKASYMDTRAPFANYRFLDEFNSALGHNMDKAFDPKSAIMVARKPKLLLYAFFGSWMPSADEPAAVWKKPA